MIIRNTPEKDRYCSFNFNPNTGQYERNWIQYADGTFEPMRRDGNISSKWNGEQTDFKWWATRKPVEWRPWDEGYGFSWNHDLGDDSKPGDWGNKSQKEREAGNAPYFLELELNDDHRIESRTERIDGRRETLEYEYDDQGRLAGVLGNIGWAQDFEYDERGRRSADYMVGRQPFMRTFVYGDDDRLMSVNATRYEHDEAGFRSAMISGNEVTRYAYAGDYRLLFATMPDGREITYEHDDDGQRNMKLVNGEPVEAYDWIDLIRLGGFYDGHNEYVFDYENGKRLPRTMHVGNRMFSLKYDQVGSLKAVVDDTGNVVKAIQYDAFGVLLCDTNPDFRIPLGFAGGLHDPDTGFIRFGWRDYDPQTGRWTAQDPIGDAGGDSDWYGYCLDDPVNGIDPLGLWTDEHGNEISDGRPITEYFLGIGTPFSAIGTQKNVRMGLHDKKKDYSDNNDWEIRRNLENEANNFGFWDGVLGTYRFKSDEKAVEHYTNKAKHKIGKH